MLEQMLHIQKQKAQEDQHYSRYSHPANPNVFLDIARDGEFIGRLTIELFENFVPKTVDNFRALITGQNELEHSFKNNIFHRSTGGFLCNAGDITKQNGAGGWSIYGDKFDDEMMGLSLSHYKRGILGLNNNNIKNNNSSQFYITFTNTTILDGTNVIFGQLAEVGPEAEESEKILRAIEVGGSTGGEPTSEFKIINCGEISR